MGIRSFVAIKVPDLITPQLVGLQRELQNSPIKVRWVEPQNFHLTLHFIGDVDPEKVEDIVRELKTGVKDFSPFSLNFAGVGGFPREGKLRVVWAGVGRGRNELLKLQPAVVEALKRAEVEIEGDNKFHPHLTLGRVKGKTNTRPLRVLLEEQRGFVSSDFSVSSLQLIKSQLTPSGPVYSVLEDISFRCGPLDK